MRMDINYYFEHLAEFPLPGFFDGLEHPWDALVRVKEYLKKLLVEPDVKEMHGDLKENAHFYDNYYVGEGTVIYNDVTIMGPVYIGKNCEIMPGSIIRPWTAIGDNCVMNHCCEIKHSVVMNGAKIASTAFVGDSVIGKSARIGSGVIVANRKFDQSSVKVKADDGSRYDLGTTFFGCVLGDSSRLGANSVTQPGTHIGPHTWVYPATNVRGFIPAQKRVFHDKPIIMEDNELIELQP